MTDDEIPRHLPERTGKHYCVSCRAEASAETYFALELLCPRCAEEGDEYPLASTPNAPKRESR